MLEQPAFGQRLRALRVKRGLSQVALAGDGMSTGYLSRLESGTRRPNSRIVEYLAQRLGVPVTELAAPSVAQSGPPSSQTSSLVQFLAAAISTSADDETTESLAAALRNSDSWDSALRWQALWLLARTLDGKGRHEEEHALLTELTQLSDELGAPELRARAYTRLSRCVRMLGDNDSARDHAMTAWQAAEGLFVADRAGALHALVSAEAELGHLNEAWTHADRLCALTEQSTGTLQVEALWAAATVRLRQGDYRGARELLERALLGLDGRQNLMLWTRLRLAAASLYLQLTEPLTDRAQALLDEVTPVLRVVGTELHDQQLQTLRAHLAFEQGRLDEARAICGQIDECALLLSFRDRIRFQALCCRLRILDGDHENAVRELQELARQAQEARNPELTAEVWRTIAETLAQRFAPAPTGSPPRSGHA
ncbi:helix-turn-helix domain-containing protein [Planosporangium sp. 12N6]|uniref:helix-turn-helix domain-containing protein n=1 Tax=Planosporangium spinosum TaxID=3402278 RepID=UPI003CF0C00D